MLQAALPIASWVAKQLAVLVGFSIADKGLEGLSHWAFGGDHEEKMLKKQAAREGQERLALRLLAQSERNDELLAEDEAAVKGGLISSAQTAQDMAEAQAASKYRAAGNAATTIASMPGLPTAMGGFGPGEHPVSIADLLGVDL